MLYGLPLDNEEFVAFIDHEIELLNRKSNGKRKPTKNGNPRNDLQIINHDQERKGTMEEEEDVRFFYQWIDG